MELLEGVCDFINGGPWSDTEYADAGIRVVKVSNMEDGTIVPRADDSCLPDSKYNQYKKHELRTGDIVVATVGSHPTQPGSVVGRTSRIPSHYAGSFLNQNAVCLRVKCPTRYSQRYLFYLSKTVLFSHHIESRARGSANQVRMAVSELKKFKSTFPEIEVQQKIAAILAGYDELIERNKQRIVLLEELAEEIYREWFVRLRFPGYEKVKVVKRIPDGWSFDKAGEFFSLAKGKSYAGEEITDDPQHMPFISLKSFNRGGGYRADGLKYYSGRYKDEQVVRHNDVVIALTDMTQDRAVVGRAARMPDFGERGAVISLDAVKLVPSNTNNTFLYAFMRHSGFADLLKEFANGANVLHLKPDLITKQRIVFPPLSLQNDFATRIAPFYSQSDTLAETNDRLTTTRNLLLPRLISGKLSVENLHIQFTPGMTEELSDAPTATADA